MIYINADDIAFRIEVKHESIGDFPRMGAGPAVEVDVQGIRFGIVVQPHETVPPINGLWQSEDQRAPSGRFAGTPGRRGYAAGVGAAFSTTTSARPSSSGGTVTGSIRGAAPPSVSQA